MQKTLRQVTTNLSLHLTQIVTDIQTACIKKILFSYCFSETRKTCKSVVSVKTITPKEAWILKLQSREQQHNGSSSSQDEGSEDNDDSSAQDEPKLKKTKLV